MTDDSDRTREFPRDGRGHGDTPGPRSGGAEPTTDFSRTGPGQAWGSTGPSLGSDGPPQDYSAPGGYPPGGAGPAYASGYQPPMRADRGGSGFPAALIGAVVAAVLLVVGSFVAHQWGREAADRLDGWTAWFMQILSTAAWPADGAPSRYLTAFVAAVVVVLFLTLLLLTAVTMSTRAGTGGFAIFLGAWMCCVLAGATARPIAGLIGRDTMRDTFLRSDVMVGATWGLTIGWIVGFATAVVHLMRRKPVAF